MNPKILDFTRQAIINSLSPEQLDIALTLIDRTIEEEKKETIEITDMQFNPCELCGETIDSFAGNPSKWGTGLPVHGGNGKIKYYHLSCLAKMIVDRDELITALIKEIIKCNYEGGSYSIESSELIERITNKSIDEFI